MAAQKKRHIPKPIAAEARKVVTSPKRPPVKEIKPFIPEKWQDLFYIVLIAISCFIFLGGAIFSGGFPASDNIASASFDNYRKAVSESGGFPLWIPYIFSGMPAYASLLVTGERWWDFIAMLVFGFHKFFGMLFGSDAARMASIYAIYGAGMYLLLRVKDVARFAAFFGGFAAVFSTWVITWVMIGHNTKPVVLSMLPFVFISLIKLRVKFSLLYLILLAFALHIMLEATHVQMIFYGLILVGFYFLFDLIHSFKNKSGALRSLSVIGLFILAGGAAFLMSSDRYLSTLEYTPYSTRGAQSVLDRETSGTELAKKEEEAYKYATMWSYSPQELITFFVPNYFGFGKRDNVFKLQTGRGQTPPQKIETYWGQKESEDSPPYMGILALGLALLGFIVFRKEPLVQALSAAMLFAVFLSFGKNLPLLYDIFYYLIPNFEKFRAPSMSLAVMHFAVPLLAGFGLTAILGWRKNFGDNEKKLLKAGFVIAVVFLAVGLLYSAAFKSVYIDSLPENFPNELKNWLWSETVSDWLINGAIGLAMVIMAFLFARGKMSLNLFLPIVAGLLIFDLWRVDYRPMETAKKSLHEDYFKLNEDVYNFLKQDKTHFRVFDPQTGIPAYYLVENVNGYHAAKLRIYQDLMDAANFQSSTHIVDNPFLWRLMNVKYIVAYQPIEGVQPVYQSPRTGTLVYYAPEPLPRVFFVESVEVAKDLDILKHLKEGDFEPMQKAYIEKQLPEKIEPPAQGAFARIAQKNDEYLKIEVNATGNNFLFISEIYYPPGWKAFINGKETPVHKVNYAFRGIVVPKGNHTVEMKFESKNFETGKNISLGLNILAFLALGAGLFIERKTVFGKFISAKDDGQATENMAEEKS